MSSKAQKKKEAAQKRREESDAWFTDLNQRTVNLENDQKELWGEMGDVKWGLTEQKRKTNQGRKGEFVVVEGSDSP